MRTEYRGATRLRASRPRQYGPSLGTVPISALFALVVGIVLTAFLFAQVYRLETEKDNIEFARRAEVRWRIFSQSVHESVAGLRSINRLFAINSTPISREQFREITLPLLAEQPYVRTFMFHRYVTFPQRRAYEAAMRGIYSGFTIKHVQAGKLVPATSGKGPYLVVEYVEPLAGNEYALGYDVLSEPVVALPIRRAIDTGLVSASGLRPYARRDTAGKVFTIMLPVYRRGAPLHDVAARRRAFIGDTVAGFDAYRLAQLVFERAGLLDVHDIHINVYAAASPDEAALMFRHGAAPPRTASASPLVVRLLGPAALVSASHTVDFAGMPWHIVVSRDPSGMEAHPNALLLLAAGVLLTLLSTAYLKAAAARSRIIEQTVESRTAQLQATTSELELRNRAIEASVNAIFITVRRAPTMSSSMSIPRSNASPATHLPRSLASRFGCWPAPRRTNPVRSK